MEVLFGEGAELREESVVSDSVPVLLLDRAVLEDLAEADS